MYSMTLEHLLSGAAAVEDQSRKRTSNNTNSDSPSDSQSHSDSSRSSSGDENSQRADNQNAGSPASQDVLEPPQALKFLKTEHGAVAASGSSSERELTPIQPMPKLPPISSLTQPNGLPPSLQAQQPPPHQAIRPHPSSAAASTASTAAAGGAVQDETLCRYRNKLCLNGRAVKRNGELHNLCEKHRAKANQNQRKLESKRRVQKRQTRHVPSAPPRTYQLTAMGAAVMPSEAMHHLPPGHSGHGVQALPSLAQLHRPPPPQSQQPPSSSSSSYPYYDGNNYPPYSR